MHIRGSSDWIREGVRRTGRVVLGWSSSLLVLRGDATGTQQGDATGTTLGRDKEQAIGNRSMDP